MIRKKVPMIVLLIVALIGAFEWLSQMPALGNSKDNKTPYPSMAALERYLMPRDAEIALARSAAPAAISRDATVLVLGRKGFEVPRIDDAAWGANLPNSPVMGGAQAPEPFSEFIVPVGKWSDGTAVPTN